MENVINNNKYCCYIIRSTNPAFSNSTYNGSTNNLVRRLRQHNGEIVGGAKATRGKGPWVYIAIWEGFQSHREALSCEWRIKHTNGRPGKRPNNHLGVIGRIIGLNEVLKLPKWTSKCTVDNQTVNYKLYIAEDVETYICRADLPTNIQVVTGIPEL